MAYYYTPFFKEYEPPASSECPFCSAVHIETQLCRDHEGNGIENEHFWWMVNWFPKYEGATMVVPKRHTTSLADITPEESAARDTLIARVAEILTRVYSGAGTEIFLQTGSESFASVTHLHWHVFPAEKNNPFPSYEKTNRFFTTVPQEQKVILYPTSIRLAREDLLAAVRRVAI